ncbi:MAG: arginine repressor [Firmicutes bacterium]|nr:arginine repressor [Bacillota bacterium]
MTRTRRQSKILEVISGVEIETQDDLVKLLEDEGLKITQATISRDIKELGLIKVLGNNKKYKYVYVDSGEQKISTKFLNMLRESVISIKTAANMIVIKTLSGSANTAGMAVDKLNYSEVVGCVAGDDTLLIILESAEDAVLIQDKLSQVIY